MRLLLHWDHSVLSPPLDLWDQWDLCHPWVQLDHSAPLDQTDRLRLSGPWDHWDLCLPLDRSDP